MLIGLNGPARCGKDTVFNMLRDGAAVSGLVVKRFAFADLLKLSAARALGFDGTTEECVEFCNQIKEEGVGITVASPSKCLRALSGREFLQRYGTEAHRDVFDTNFWVEAALPVDYEVPTGEVHVFTDVRFTNEAERIRRVGGRVWRIQRERSITESAHASEKPLPLDLVDYGIPNNGSLEELQDKVRETFLTTQEREGRYADYRR